MRTVVAVLRGGPSSEYDVSLKSGANILSSLNQERYEPRDVFIDRQGQWHVHGMPATPEKALSSVDVAFNVIHGEYGEDGRIQRVLDALGVPYTGPGTEAAMLSFNKQRTREVASQRGIKIAHGTVVEVGADIDALALKLFREFPFPAVVKPVIGGSSVGVSVVRNFHTLTKALQTAATVSPIVLVEEYIQGKEATVGVIENFRGQKMYALMPIEIIPPASRPFFDYEAKYSGETVERVPGNFTKEEKTQLEEIACRMHEGLGLPHYSRSDFIVSPRGIYFLETNSAPAIGLTNESLLPKALTAAGTSVPDFLEHVITLAHK